MSRILRYIVLGALVSLLPSFAFAQSVSVDQMFANFSTSAIALMNLVRWTALPVGVFISIQGLLKLKEMGQSGGRVSPKTPIMLTLIGACLIAFPATSTIATQSLSLGAATGTSLSRIPNVGGAPGVGEAMTGILLFVKLIGHISFFRGFLMLSRNAQGDNNATIGKALIFIGAGAAAINIDTFITVLANSVAPGLQSFM